jgi:hypothetical protein
MYKGYTPRRKSRYHKLGSNIKIGIISYTYPSRICYYIYKESNHFIADYNIKDNIRKFIAKLRKNKKNIVRLHGAIILLREKRRTNQVEKPRDLLALIITTRLLIKTYLISILQIILTQKSLLLLRNRKQDIP